MALSFLLDEHLRGPLWRGIQRHNLTHDASLNVVRVGDPDDLPLGANDPEILLWAERHNRILGTQWSPTSWIIWQMVIYRPAYSLCVQASGILNSSNAWCWRDLLVILTSFATR